MVQDDKSVGLDGVNVVFDDERVVSDAGVMLVATLARRLGVEALAGELVRPRSSAAGRLAAGALDAGDVLRAFTFGTCASSTRCSAGPWSGRGRPAPARATGGW